MSGSLKTRTLVFIFQVIASYLLLILVSVITETVEKGESLEEFMANIELSLEMKINAIILTLMLIVGFPIRLIKPLNKWWKKNWYCSLSILLAGIIFIILSYDLPQSSGYYIKVNGEFIEATHPNTLLILPGYLMSCFGCLHFFPTKELFQQLKEISHVYKTDHENINNHLT